MVEQAWKIELPALALAPNLYVPSSLLKPCANGTDIGDHIFFYHSLFAPEVISKSFIHRLDQIKTKTEDFCL